MTSSTDIERPANLPRHDPSPRPNPSTTQLVMLVLGIIGVSALVVGGGLVGLTLLAIQISARMCETHTLPSEKCDVRPPPPLTMVDPAAHQDIGCWRRQSRVQIGVLVGNKLIQAAPRDGLTIHLTGQALDDPTIEPFSVTDTFGRSLPPPATIGQGTGYVAVDVNLPDRLRQHPVNWTATASTLSQPDVEQISATDEFGPCLFSLSGDT